MKGPFGLLLIGGGIILVVGLFTGKITFPGGTGTGSNPIQDVINSITTPQKLVGSAAKPLPKGVQADPNKYPVFKPASGESHDLGFGIKSKCPSGYVEGSDGNCYSAAGI